MLENGLLGVFRTGRGEPAAAGQERGHALSIEPQDADRDRTRAHRDAVRRGIASRASRRSPTRVGKGTVSREGRAITISAAVAGAASRVARYASRILRRARFRATAPRICRLTANPARLGSFPSRHSTISERRSIRLPRWKSAWNSAPVVSRSRRGKPRSRRRVVSVPWRGGVSAPCGRPSSSCARETHASSRGGADSVETFAS